ncbi:hypothetical protein [Bradyrhizobium sp. 33ap4]|uniref:hypothetical protein n=1 Tax=Bradyrhizobium sp. 33ap4 TaxID=3061630 RepID=UPI0029306745|nr:hypothetical protein [Bradyrhizobium sp. 33ap4]
MPENVNVELGGKSRHEVAYKMAFDIITKIEKKSLSDVTTEHYLATVRNSGRALSGLTPI